MFLKLCNRARGAGCIPILAADLDLALERLLILPDNVEAWLDGQDREFPVECKWGCFQEQIRHWWSNECPVFVAEELCKSAPVQQEGKAFDGTMRVGFSLHRVEEPAESEAEAEEEELTFHNAPDPEPAVEFPGEALPGSLSIEWLGGYWKLPAEDTTSSDLTAKVISKARQGTAPVDVQQLQEVYAALGDSVQQVFTNASLSPQTLLRRYPDISELGAFVASRLACSMRMRDPTKSQMVLGLAQTSLSKCKEPGKRDLQAFRGVLHPPELWCFGGFDGPLEQDRGPLSEGDLGNAHKRHSPLPSGNAVLGNRALEESHRTVRGSPAA